MVAPSPSKTSLMLKGFFRSLSGLIENMDVSFDFDVQLSNPSFNFTMLNPCFRNPHCHWVHHESAIRGAGSVITREVQGKG